MQLFSFSQIQITMQFTICEIDEEIKIISDIFLRYFIHNGWLHHIFLSNPQLKTIITHQDLH